MQMLQHVEPMHDYEILLLVFHGCFANLSSFGFTRVMLLVLHRCCGNSDSCLIWTLMSSRIWLSVLKLPSIRFATIVTPPDNITQGY